MPDVGTCPRCGAARVQALDCPRCGVIYAKAEALALAAAVAGLPHAAETLDVAGIWPGEDSDEALELRLRTFAIPVALGVAAVAVWSNLGHFFVRTFASMWVHETGHAVAAWLCGYLAFPGPWFTPVANARSPILATAIAGALGYASFRCWKADRRALATTCVGLLAVQSCCTLLLGPRTARQFIIFAGDGGCLVLGTLLMATVYAPREGAIRRGWLRWGFLAIGAVSFADAFAQWWGSRSDPDRIPFGHNEGSGLSDPSVLTELFGWSETTLVRRYVVLGCVCLAAVAAVYCWGLWQARPFIGARQPLPSGTPPPR
jgi:hypothetical protein